MKKGTATLGCKVRRKPHGLTRTDRWRWIAYGIVVYIRRRNRTTGATGPQGLHFVTVTFGDNEEVQAQRQIKAAEVEQQAREGGFAPIGRTASTKGAKKIGQVQRGKPATVDQALENLWDRP